MKFLLVFLFLNISFSLNQKLYISADFFTTDDFGNIFLIKGQNIKKINSEGKEIANFQNVYFGNIHQIDVSNPLRILVFYKEFNQLLFLDKNLHELSQVINLDDLGLEDVELVCSADDGSFWLLNMTNLELINYNNDLKIINKSIRLHHFINDENRPNFLLIKHHQIFLNIPNLGILVFDNLANYQQTIFLKNLKKFQIKAKEIFFYKENQLKKFNFAFKETENIFSSDISNIIEIRKEQNNIYVLTKDSLYIYQSK